jgi:hypothetical protein
MLKPTSDGLPNSVPSAVHSEALKGADLERQAPAGEILGLRPGTTLTDEFEFPIGRRTRWGRSCRRRIGWRHHFGSRR